MPSIPNLVEKSLEDKWEDYVDSFEEPASKNLWASDGDWRLVGNGEQTDGKCGRFRGFFGCVNDEGHNKTTLEGDNFEGMAYVHLAHYTCGSYHCPVCYLSWAVHAAHRITDKLAELALKFGQPEHIVLSLPDNHFKSTDDFEKLLVKVVRALKRRNIVGGTLIFHGFRYADFQEAKEKNVKFGWRWSPHFHILGFIQRKKDFYASIPKMFLKDGFVVKLKDKRQSVFGTAWYQLNHASVKFRVKHFEVARWFGVASHGCKVEVKEHNSVCPICGKELVKLQYFGVRTDLKKDLQQCKAKDRRFFDAIIDKVNQTLNWAEK